MANYNAPTKQDMPLVMGYTGVVDTITIIKDGLYKFELLGGGGGNCSWRNSGGGSAKPGPGNSAVGGAGGKTTGYKYLTKGTIIYACVAGGGGYTGGTTFDKVIGTGGFNGGQSGHTDTDEGSGGSGGATHIATISGKLENIGSSRLNTILAVAGGGGGAFAGIDYGETGSHYGGNGGGLSGQAGTNAINGVIQKQSVPGTQNSGYAFGKGEPHASVWNAPGGGGLYGGYSRNHPAGDFFMNGAGGSGYIGGVPTITYKGVTYSPQTIQGGANNAGSGVGRIMCWLIQRTPLIYYGDTEVDMVYYGDNEIDTIYYGDKEIS